MSRFKFNYKGKIFSIEVEECKTLLEKTHGLMFKKKSKPLLFIFSSKTKEAIHSFFCIPFIAIWFNENKIVDIKYVKPYLPWITPKSKFDRLLEIPKGTKEFKFFIDEK